MKSTLRDIAEAAGVSAMTVSKVLHGTGQNVRVSPETTQLVQRIAKDLRYEPNHLARSFRSRRTGMIGVVFQHLQHLSEGNPYYPQLLNGIMGALFPAGYTLALCPKLVQRSDTGSISDGRFDGVLWCRPDFTEDSVEGIRTSSTPVVVLHAPPGSADGVPTFCANNEGAMRVVVDHLTGLGHERIGFVIDTITSVTAEGRARANAFLAAMEEHGLRGDLLVWDNEEEELARYVGANPPHTALAAFGDTYAGNLLLACERLGIKVPDQLSVVGFDSSAFCERTHPRLTSVFQPVTQMAHEATSYLLRLVEHGPAIPDAMQTKNTLYDCTLDIRDSTSPPAR